MKRLRIILLLSLCAFIGMAQSKEALDKIESARIALITERLGLTPEQAEKFWPVYREYSSQREVLRQEFIAARRDYQDRKPTEEESQRLLQVGLQLKERELALDRIYNDRLITVINNRQLLELRRAEQDFRRMLMERLQRQEADKERWRNMQQRREMGN